jgi:hypothetical protein
MLSLGAKEGNLCIVNSAEQTYLHLRRIERGRPLKNAQFRSSSRKARILTAGIHWVF